MAVHFVIGTQKLMRTSRMFHLLAKRQRAGAVQDASHILGIGVLRTASWSAVALHRFSQRHIKLCQCSLELPQNSEVKSKGVASSRRHQREIIR
jgi:hypothetical protein